MTDRPPDIFEGIVERYEVRRPSRFVFVVTLLLLGLVVAFYMLATSEHGAAIMNLAATEPPPTARQQVQDALRRIDDLRAQSRYDEAYALLHQFHELYPEEANLNRELGWHHVEKGLYVFAAEYFELAAEKTPGNSKLNWCRGELHLRWGERVEEEAARGDIDEREKVERLGEAADHFARSRDFFTAANAGDYVYNRDSARDKRRKAVDGWHRSRFKRAGILYLRAKGAISTDTALAREALEDLERLQQEQDLSVRLREQTDAMIRQIMREE